MFYAHYLILRRNRNALINNVERRLPTAVDRIGITSRFAKFLRATRALAIPLTYLILFVSSITIISATYSFAVIKIAAKGASVKASVAKQDMQRLDTAIHRVAWTSGASEVVYVDDFGGVFKIDPTARNLAINFAGDQAVNDVVFNSPTGNALCRLESSEENYAELYIKGDERAIENQTAFGMTQLYGQADAKGQSLVLCYRPVAMSTATGTTNGKPANLVRIYITNLNASQNLATRGSFYLRITSLNVSSSTFQYEFNQSISSISLNVVFGENVGSVLLPVSSNENGATVNLETVICSIRLEKVEV